MADAPAVAPAPVAPPKPAAAPAVKPIAYTVGWDTMQKPFPAGTVAGGWLVQVDGQPDQTVMTRGSIARAIPPGDHSVTITRLDDTGKALGEPVIQKFTSGGSVVMIEVPKSVIVIPA
jgi:hypothetical protein